MCVDLKFATTPECRDPEFDMTNETPTAKVPSDAARKPLTPAAQRALAEAEARRAQAERDAGSQTKQPELQGPKGPEPTRYGDWERKGIASDF